MIKTDIVIIGAGPVGLFAVFEAGLMKLHCHLIDAIPQAGGHGSPADTLDGIFGYEMASSLQRYSGLYWAVLGQSRFTSAEL